MTDPPWSIYDLLFIFGMFEYAGNAVNHKGSVGKTSY